MYILYADESENAVFFKSENRMQMHAVLYFITL